MNDSEYPRCAEAAEFFARQMRAFAHANPAIADMAERFRARGVDIHTLVDHWVLPWTPDEVGHLCNLGLTRTATGDGDTVWEHRHAGCPASG